MRYVCITFYVFIIGEKNLIYAISNVHISNFVFYTDNISWKDPGMQYMHFSLRILPNLLRRQASN